MHLKIFLLALFIISLAVHGVLADYLWHKDEIPYEPRSKCQRGTSYYSNSINANDTDIQVASSIESLLDYNNFSVCKFCVCSVHGQSVSCINRDPWFCAYYRRLRQENAARDLYKNLFKQDRPSYFRQLSYRIRRSMDDGMFALLESVGTSLDRTAECIPFVSQYSDCTDANICTGCRRCTCNANGRWNCKSVYDCSRNELYQPVGDANLDNALQELEKELLDRQKGQFQNNNDLTDGKIIESDMDVEKQILSMLPRRKRSLVIEASGIKKINRTSFHNTVDELNEDTIKNSNYSGTIPANKIYPVVNISRRVGSHLEKGNPPNTHSLQIEYNHPQAYTHHITDNKIDTTANGVHKIDMLSHEKLHSIISNHTQDMKDKDLSKLVVNELQKGAEIIGDKNAPVMSNITFTPENDTLTAMAYIAGNLLNKLWSMEKGAGDDSIESEILKHEKISELLELFKEPMSLKQEKFLKDVLEKLSHAVDTNKDVENMSLCEKVENVKKELHPKEMFGTKNSSANYDHIFSQKEKKTNAKPKKPSTALSKIKDVLNMIENFEKIQGRLRSLKNMKPIERTQKNNSVGKENIHQYKFLNMLETITELLIPSKNAKHKFLNKMKEQRSFEVKSDLLAIIKQFYNIDLDGTTLTPKDKIIVDYLSTVKNKPECLQGSEVYRPQYDSTSKVQGDILRNLSEFFKIKSLVDLVKLLDKGKPEDVKRQDSRNNSSKRRNNFTESSRRLNNSQTFADTKKKLKNHLKSIIEDLTELEKSREGYSSNITVAKFLPCVNKLLAEDTFDIKNNEMNNLDKIKQLFNDLKEEQKYPTRKSLALGVRPKSAEIWERVVKTFDAINEEKTRRNLGNITPRPYSELKKMMGHLVQSGSYRNQAFYNLVPPSERLVLLKTLEMDVKRFVDLLKDTKFALDTGSHLSRENINDINRFLTSAITNINLSAKVFETLKNKRQNFRRFLIEYQDSSKIAPKLSEALKLPVDAESYSQNNNKLKLTRDQLVNQLIKNRVEHYIKIKENNGVYGDGDSNYSIAKKILENLENQNYGLARQLYKLFVTSKIKQTENREEIEVTSTLDDLVTPRLLVLQSPMVQYNDHRTPLEATIQSQDYLLKQLLKIRNLKR